MEIANVWLQSGLPALIRGVKLIPQQHPRFKNLAYYEEGKQGRAFHLSQPSNKREWILKKFNSEMQPERSYISSVRTLVPKSISFQAAAKRIVLVPEDIKIAEGAYSSAELAKWLDGTILMPKMPGTSWQNVSKGIRGASLELSLAKRIAFALSLAEAVVEMEQEGCAHRDLCHESVLLDLQENIVYLIDWDSMFHGSLYYFKNTPAGSPGYMASWIGDKSKWDSRKSWNRKADRFSLSILISEILLVNQESPSFYDGAMYSQEMFGNPQHPFFQKVLESLGAISENLQDFFHQTLNATTYEECPDPIKWKEALESIKVEDIPGEEKGEAVLEFDEAEEIASSEREYSSSSKGYWFLLLLVLIPLAIWFFNKEENKNLFSWSSSNKVAPERKIVQPIQPERKTEQQITTPENTPVSPKEVIPITQVNSPDAPNPDAPNPLIAKKYLIQVMYVDNDLRMKIDGQEITLNKNNTAEVQIKPGNYNMEISFSTVIIDRETVKKGSTVTSTAQIIFDRNENIIIQINRSEGTWRQSNTP